jgi:hypothetical protein
VKQDQSNPGTNRRQAYTDEDHTDTDYGMRIKLVQELVQGQVFTLEDACKLYAVRPEHAYPERQ